MEQITLSVSQLLEIFTQKLNKKFIMGENYFQIKPGDIVLDIGACTGDMSLYYSWRVGDTGRVYAIEPDKKGNIKKVIYTLKDTKNVHICNLAITNSTGKSPLYLSRDTSHHSMRKDFLWSQENEERFELMVNTYTLDDFVDYVKIPKIDIIYMNIEGSELDVLEGGLKTLTNMSPKIYIAPHELDGINLKEQLIRKLESYSYKVKEFNGLLYASKHPEDFDIQEHGICQICEKPIDRHEDMRFDGVCWDCYSVFLQSWMKKIIGL